MNALNERVRKEVRYGPLRSQQERILSFRLPRSLHTNIHALKQATTISTYFPSHGSQSRRQMTVKRRDSGAVSCILRAVKTPPLFFWVTQALTVKAARPFQKPVFPCKSTRRRAAFWAPRRGGGRVSAPPQLRSSYSPPPSARISSSAASVRRFETRTINCSSP